MDNFFPSDIFPLAVGKKWSYIVSTGFLFNRNADVFVTDKKNSLYVVKVLSGKYNISFIVKSDVDMSIIAYSKTGADTIADGSAFESIPRIEILKSPIMKGTIWNTDFGDFNIVNQDYKLVLDKKVYNDCVFVQLKDTSNAINDFFIKKGIGLIFAAVYVDGIGKVHIKLRKS